MASCRWNLLGQISSGLQRSKMRGLRSGRERDLLMKKNRKKKVLEELDQEEVGEVHEEER